MCPTVRNTLYKQIQYKKDRKQLISKYEGQVYIGISVVSVFDEYTRPAEPANEVYTSQLKWYEFAANTDKLGTMKTSD